MNERNLRFSSRDSLFGTVTMLPLP